MGWHVVGPFRAMHQIGHGWIIGVWHEPLEEAVQIALDIRIRILLDDEGTGCVLTEQRQQAVLYRLAADESVHIGRKLIQPLPAR